MISGVRSKVREKLSSMNNQDSNFQSLILFYLAVQMYVGSLCLSFLVFVMGIKDEKGMIKVMVVYMALATETVFLSCCFFKNIWKFRAFSQSCHLNVSLTVILKCKLQCNRKKTDIVLNAFLQIPTALPQELINLCETFYQKRIKVAMNSCKLLCLLDCSELLDKVWACSYLPFPTSFFFQLITASHSQNFTKISKNFLSRQCGRRCFFGQRAKVTLIIAFL